MQDADTGASVRRGARDEESDGEVKLRQLLYFAEVVDRNLNISAAARALGIAQSGISRQMHALEAALGVALFVRSGRRIDTITAAGEFVLGKAKEVLRIVREMSAVKNILRRPGEEPIYVGASHNLSRYISQVAAVPYLARHPDRRVRLHAAPSHQIMQLVEEHALDFGFVTDLPKDGSFPGITMRSFLQWGYCLIAEHTHPLVGLPELDVRQVADHPVITCSSSVVGDSWLHALGDETSIHAALTVADEEMVKTAVRRLPNSLGIIPRLSYLQSEDKDLRVLDCPALVHQHSAFLCLPKGLALDEHMQEFISALPPVAAVAEPAAIGSSLPGVSNQTTTTDPAGQAGTSGRDRQFA